ncbi:MAG TPA: hypothetical protein VK671_13575, partial [Mucilaginibacter sp.]|nr:hypothetical protein [Mucilaginibacter sp.]
MKKQLLILSIVCFSLIISSYSKAQTAVVKISGEVTEPMTINDDDLHKFTQTTVTRKDHDGKEHTYSG